LIESLTRPASRPFQSLLLKLGKEHGKAVIDSILTPIISGQKFGNAQSELCNRIIKECLTDSLKRFLLEKLISADAERWKEELFLKTVDILVSKGGYSFGENSSVSDEQTLELLVNRLEELSLVEDCSRSVKFSAVVCHLLSHHERKCVSYVDKLKLVASRLKNFLHKIAIKSIEKIEALK
jgi:hypothetical protein